MTQAGAPKRQRSWPWVVLAVILVMAGIGALAGGSSDQDTGSNDTSAVQDAEDRDSADQESDSAPSEAASEATGDSGCGTRATSSCTPDVGVGKRIRVDGIYWKVNEVSTANRVGSEIVGQDADGKFVVVTVNLTSDRDEQAQLRSDQAKLITRDGQEFGVSDDAMIGLERSLIFDDINPGSTMTRVVAFDVPESKGLSGARLRVGEFGLGDGHGFIRLPAVS